MASNIDTSMAWLPVEVARLILNRLNPVENCMLSQTNRWWRTQCSTTEIWREFCRSRFQLNDITTNGFKKLAWTYPGLMSSWKDWYAFRSQFRREVAGSIEIDVLEVVVDNGDKVKRIPAKNMGWDFLCHSQPIQAVEGARGAVRFHFDEYHTLIEGEIFENRSWFYNRSSIGKFTIPVFQAKRRVAEVWVDLEEPSELSELETGSVADSEAAVMSDEEYQSGIHAGTAAPSRQVHYDLFDQHFDITSKEEILSDDDGGDYDSKSDHSASSSNEVHPRGRSRTRNRIQSIASSSSVSSAPAKSQSVPTSPKRGRTSSVKSTQSALAQSSQSVLSSSGHLPPSRPSSPPHSPLHIGSPLTDSTSPREALAKRKSVDLKSSQALPEPGWFNFLSTSPSVSSATDAPRRTVKRVLLQLKLEPVTCSVQDFEILASISHGALNSPNELFLVKDKDNGQPRFMKIVPVIPHRDDDSHPIWEGSKEAVAYSTTLDIQMPTHPFLVEPLTTFSTDNKLYMMMEWLGGGELFSVLRRTRHGRFDEHEALFYTAELVLALEHMHANKLIYRDLKPENLLLSAEGHLKITQRTPPENHWQGPKDFSIVTGHSMPEYLAPEILKGLPYSPKADSWSVGTILYHMLVGQPPFHHPNVHNLFASIIGDDPTFPSYLSTNVVNLLRNLLHRDVKKRLSLKQVKSQEWFEGLDWGKMVRREYAPPLKPFRRQDLNFGNPTRRRTPQRGTMGLNPDDHRMPPNDARAPDNAHDQHVPLQAHHPRPQPALQPLANDAPAPAPPVPVLPLDDLIRRR